MGSRLMQVELEDGCQNKVMVIDRSIDGAVAQ